MPLPALGVVMERPALVSVLSSPVMVVGAVVPTVVLVVGWVAAVVSGMVVVMVVFVHL